MTPANILFNGINRTLRPIAYIIVAFGAVIVLLGVILIYLGDAGATTLYLLGQKVNTSSVGIAAIAFACLVVTTALTKIIGVMGRTMDRILRRKDLFESPKGDSDS
jgi:hypothetical protein